MKKPLSYFTGSVISALVLSLSVAQGQTLNAQPNSPRNAPTIKSEPRLTDLLAQSGSQRRLIFSLLPSSHVLNVTGPAFGLIPMAAGPSLEVRGSGTIGRMPKWTGITSSNSFIGDSTIFEDKLGKVGIGTDTPTSRFTVAGLIETTSGGVKFPDGTIQTTAGITSNDVVRSLNGLKGDLLLAGNANITVSYAGNTITVAAPNVLTAVTHDRTLTGDGTPASPLSAVSSDSLIEPFAAEGGFNIAPSGDFGTGVLTSVPTGKRLVIEQASGTCILPIGQRAVRLRIVTSPSPTATAGHDLVPVFAGDSSTGVSRVTGSAAMKLYARPSSLVLMEAVRDTTTATASCVFSISGFFIDLAPQN